MSKKKICFVAQFPPPMHGLSKAVETLYNSYLNKVFEFEKVDLTNNVNFIKNLISMWKSKADIFYFTISQTKNGNIRDLVILNLLYLQKKKCVIHLHGGYYRILVEKEMGSFQRKMNYKVISKLEGTIVLSESLKSIFKGMISEDKIHVIPNCVDDDILISDKEFEEKMKQSRDKNIKQVIYLGNFIKSKGYRDVLELACMEKRQYEEEGKKKFHFNFAGKFFDKNEKSFFMEYVKKHNLSDFVTYHGIVGGNQKKELLKKCDVFILLTRYPNEGQPISILEAMGNGMVVVTTDHAGIPDMVEDGVNGIVVFKNIDTDIFSLYQKLIQLESEYSRYAIVNRQLYQEKYTQYQYLESLRFFFDKI